MRSSKANLHLSNDRDKLRNIGFNNSEDFSICVLLNQLLKLISFLNNSLVHWAQTSTLKAAFATWSEHRIISWVKFLLMQVSWATTVS